MNTLKTTILYCLILIPYCCFAQDSLKTQYTLEECIELALRNNADAQKGGTAVATAKINLQQAKANLLPSLDGYLSHSINTGLVTNPITNANETANITSGSQQLQSSVTLFNGLNLLRAIRQQTYAYHASEMDEQRIKDNLTMDVILAYLQVITARDVLNQNQQQLGVTRKQVERLALLNNMGEGAPGDYYDLKGQLSGDEVNVSTAKNTLKANIVTLTRLLNIPYSENLSFASINDIPSDDYEQMDYQNLYDRAANTLGTLKAAEFWKSSAEMGVKAARSLYLPSLSLNGNLNSRYSNTSPDSYYDQVQDNFGKGIGLSLNIPILSNFRRRLNVSQAKVDLRNAEIDLENTKNTLQQQTALVLINLRTSKEKYAELKKQVEAYRESFRIAQVRFEAGDINSVDFLLQKNKYDQANINLVVTQYEWQLRQRIANYYNGNR